MNCFMDLADVSILKSRSCWKKRKYCKHVHCSAEDKIEKDHQILFPIPKMCSDSARKRCGVEFSKIYHLHSILQTGGNLSNKMMSPSCNQKDSLTADPFDMAKWHLSIINVMILMLQFFLLLLKLLKKQFWGREKTPFNAKKVHERLRFCGWIFPKFQLFRLWFGSLLRQTLLQVAAHTDREVEGELPGPRKCHLHEPKVHPWSLYRNTSSHFATNSSALLYWLLGPVALVAAAVRE